MEKGINLGRAKKKEDKRIIHSHTTIVTGGGSGDGPIVWGDIGGDILNQADLIAELGLKQNTSEKNVANGYAGLDAFGKISSSQLPAIAITDTFVVGSQVAMLALTAEIGDIAVRTDLNETYVLQSSNPSLLASWVKLLTPTDTIISVFGRTGAISAVAGDYTASQITNVAAGNISSITVQAAINELDTEKEPTLVGTTISSKTLKSSLAGTEEILINDAGTLKKTTAQDIANLGGGGGGDMVLASAQTNSGAKTFLDTTFLMRNVANTFSSTFTNNNTASRVYTLKDANGTIAFTSDITGTNSGTNTGDQTSIVGISGTKAQFNTAVSDGDIVFLDSVDTITGVKTMTGLNSVLHSSSGLLVRNPANTFTYTITGAAIAANRILNLPLITGTDTLASLGLAQTFTATQTFTSPVILTSINTSSVSFTAFAGATTLLTIGGTGASASMFAPSTLDATSSTTGAIRTSGGISAAKAINVGTAITVGTTIELGHASDTTISRVSAGVVAIEGVNVLTETSTNTVSNKTLTAPRIANAGFIADANGNELIVFTTTASAVNELTIANAATANNPSITASGGDTNIGINFVTKGTGVVAIRANSTQAATLALYEDTDDGSNFSAFRASPRTTDIVYLMPTTDPTAGQVLSAAAPVANVSQLSWATVGSATTSLGFPQPIAGQQGGATSYGFTNNTLIYLGLVVVPTSIYVTQIRFWVTSTSLAGTGTIAFYDMSGTRILTGTTAGNLTAGAMASITISSTLLPAGTYYMGFNSSGSHQLRTYYLDTTNVYFYDYVQPSPVPLGTTGTTAGTSPASITVGSLTYSVNPIIPVVRLN